MAFLHRETVGAIWRLAWPAILYSFLQSFVEIVDAMMVGRLGPHALSAVGMSQQVIMLVMVAMLAVTSGSTTLVAQFYGAGDNEEVSRTVAQSVIMSVFLSAIVSGVGLVVSRPMLKLIGSRADVLDQGVAYMRIYFLGVFFLFLNFISSAVLRGVGDTVTPLKISVIVNIINVAANYLLIFGIGPFPRLGVSGAALGSVIARSVGAVIGCWLLLNGRCRVRLFLRDMREINMRLMYRTLRIGIPSGLQGIARNGSRLFLYRIIADSAAGVAAIAAVTVGFRVRMVTVMPALAIQVAAVALVGQRIGAKRIDEAERFGRESIKFCAVILSGIGVLLFFFAPWVVRAFTDSPETIRIGKVMLQFFSVGQTFAAAAIAASGGLAGAGDTQPGLVYTVIGQFFVMLPVAYLLCHHTRLDIVGVWIAWTVSEVLQFVLMYRRFAGGRWKTMEV
ncbi:MAG: MATE family efflux transporter [Planctomycetota bacterium]